jgi:hypothetical protein
MPGLLSSVDLPTGFAYPPEFVRTVELGVLNLEPWWILTGERLKERFVGLQERYPAQGYVPFAERQDNDDVACWRAAPPEVVIVHDNASPGWEHRDGRGFPTFHAWLRAAIEEFIEWGEMDVAYGSGQTEAR